MHAYWVQFCSVSYQMHLWSFFLWDSTTLGKPTVILVNKNVSFVSFQIYPTTIRTLGMGTASAWARVGAMTTPFIAQVSCEFTVVVFFLTHFFFFCR